MSFVAGCTPQVKVTHETFVVGEKTNQQCEVFQQIVRERTVKSTPVLLAPEGPKHRTEIEDKYFIRAKDSSQREIPNAKSDEFRNCGVCRPVDGSSLWVGAGIDPIQNVNTGHVAVIEGKRMVSYNEKDLHIVVFDERGIAAHRVFSVIPKWETSEEEFVFTNGNRTIIFRSRTGAMVYNVEENTTTATPQ